MEYLLKASAVIAIFYLCYKLFLQRDTFFESNRWFLLIGLITAFALPFVVIPIYIEYTPTPVGNFVINDTSALVEATEEPFNFWQLGAIVYIIGVILFSMRFLVQLGSLAILIAKNKKHKQNGYTFIETQNETPPFSFFRWIVYNPNEFNKEELQHIISHEKVHVKQYHSIDILISQLAAIVFWFNPITWFYKKDLQQNLEFIADYKAQNQSSCKKSYQHLLLKTSVPNQHIAITNNFYNSLIKKRIVMLHKSKSKKINLLKYALVLPFLALFLMGFNTEEVYVEAAKPVYKNSIISNSFIEDALISNDNTIDKEDKKEIVKDQSITKSTVKKPVISKTNSQKKTIRATTDTEMVVITKNFTDADFEKVKKDLKKKGITAKFKGIKRNDKGEITAIKIDVNSKNSNANYNISSDEAIKPIKISFDKDGNSISIGNGTTKHMHSGDAYVIKSNGGKHKIHKTGKGNNVFVISSDDEDSEIIHTDSIYFNKKHVKGILVYPDSIKSKSNPWKISIGRNTADSTNTTSLKTVVGHQTSNAIVFNSSLKTKNGEKPLILLDDIEISEEKMHTINSNNIESITVLKDETAIALHGKKAKDDVIIIKSKSNKNYKVKIGKPLNSTKTIGKSNGSGKIHISTDSDKEPLYILDGKKIRKNKFDAIDPNDIESVTVLKGESAIEKYGKKAKDGVVEITSKKKN